MDFALLADKFKVDDIVFAEYRGYMPWPGRLIEKNEKSGTITFVCTNDCKKISYRKMWPYDDQQKKKFVTKETLDYEDFRLAILMTERLVGGNDTDIIDYVWQVMHPGAEKTSQAVAPAPAPSTSAVAVVGPVPVPALTQREIELAYVRKVHQESSSLRVERQFVGEINTLRRCLTISYKNYDDALAAFDQLLKMPVSQLLLLRNFEAVNSIRLLCRFTEAESQTVNRDAAIKVKSQANKLMTGFISCFELPYSRPDFWSEFIHLSDVYMRYTMEFLPSQTGAAGNKGTQSGL